MAIATAARISGIDLMVTRRQAGLTQDRVAAAMGVARTRISALERQYQPPKQAVARFLAAIEQATSAAQ